METLLTAIATVEKAIDTHPTMTPPRADEEGIGGVEIVFSRSGWTVNCRLKRRDARKNVRWTSAGEFAETLDLAVADFVESLDRWAIVLGRQVTR